MAKRTSSTKTTRNTEFNYFNIDDTTRGYVTSVTANTKAKKAENRFQNIKLLDVNEGIEKSGLEILSDGWANTNLVEINLGVDKNTADALALFARTGDPGEGSPLKPLYDKLTILLQTINKTWSDIGKMIIDYTGELTATNKYYIFGAPDQQVLNNRQNYNNCGIESTLNNLAMAGIIKMKENLSDQKSIEKTFLKEIWGRNLANDNGEIGVLDEPDGGTLPDDYRDIMKYFGISSKAYFITNKSDGYVYDDDNINLLAYKISQGHGAVLGLSSDVLWNDTQSEQAETNGSRKIDHAIAITGVVYDTDTPYDAENDTYATPVGFYIHDTGAWMTRFVTLKDFKEIALCDYTYGEKDDIPNHKLSSLKAYDSRTEEYIYKTEKGIFVTLTDEPIKTDVFNLNATGDKYDNIIWGNNSDNIVKGMKGSDTLYGRGGNDTIYGGAGNDIVVGNNAFKFTANVAGDSYSYDTIEDFKVQLTRAKVDIDTQLNRIDIIDHGTKDFDDYSDAYDYITKIVPSGINTLYGDAGNDIIIGGEYADLIYGGAGNDYIYGADGRNAIYAGAGNDVIVGGFDNDKLFGDAGNDYIFGLEDEDTINGGAGNDHIYGGRGDDTIETGKGNDIVYIEGKSHGADTISSAGGTNTINFIDEVDKNGETISKGVKVSDMYFDLASEKNNANLMNLSIAYQKDMKNSIDNIEFKSLFNAKTNKVKDLTIVDADDDIYKVSVSGKSKATVANIKENGDNNKINNILFTTNENGTKITTSTKNDVVVMVESDNIIRENAIDKIAYTGGKDKYISEDRNTYYTVDSIDKSTNLLIYDNVDALKKVDIDPVTYEPIKINNYVSKDDRLYTDSAKSSLMYLFDIGIDDADIAVTTKNTGLFLVKGTDYKNIINGTASGGFVYMDSFFGHKNLPDTKIIADSNFYGNGQIEGIYYGGSDTADDYNADLIKIAGQVAGWLANSTYDTAFEAINDLQGDALTEFMALYTPQS